MKYPLLATAAALVLASCTGSSEVLRSYSEAGSLVDTGSFGNSTMNNTRIMTGEKRYIVDLNEKFRKSVPDTVTFEFNSARLDEAARAALRQQADFIRQYPEVRFRVYGHTDAVGSAAYNKRLGLRRAQAVVNYLVSQGISRSRLEAMVSYGESQPLVVTQGRERRNRRTVTEVSGFLKDHPLIMDGRYADVVYREYLKSAEPASALKMVKDAKTTANQ